MVSAYDVTSTMLSSWYEILTAMVPPLHYSLMGNVEKMNAVKEQKLSLLGTTVGPGKISKKRISSKNCKCLGSSMCQARTTLIY